jgi:hypothetical protein
MPNSGANLREQKEFYRRLGQQLSVAGLALLLAALVWAQAPAQQPQPTAAQQQQPEPGKTQPAQDSSSAARPAQESAGEGARATHEEKISSEEARELLRSVDEILKFASKDSSLPIKHEVKRKLTSRDEVVAYITKHMSEDEDAQRLRRSELVLKKFGLLPRDFDLSKFLVALLREQVAGYYDPKTKTVNLLDWVDPEQQRPVLAHELTHALQDQSFGLEKWMKAGAADLTESRKQPTPADIESDEISAARQAVIEGQAMAVLIDYTLAPTGQSLTDSPQIVEALKQGMLVGTADSVQFHDAPIYLKEALTFPYRYGIDFVTELLTNGGKEKAFAGVFTNPPRTTRQIMEPKTYLSGERLEPMPLPDFQQIFRNYQRFDIGAIGEFDVAVLIDQYAGAEASRELYPHWRGGYYYAAKAKGNREVALGLLYVSRWSSAQTAARFAAIYAKSLPKRYQHLHSGTRLTKQPPLDLETLETLTGRRMWLTEEGPVVIEVQGDTLMVSESLDMMATQEAEQALFATAALANANNK